MSSEKPNEKPLTYRGLDQTTLLDRIKLEHLMGATQQVQSRLRHPPHRTTIVSDFKTSELIMELLARGFAVIKTPESGIPDTLTSK